MVLTQLLFLLFLLATFESITLEFADTLQAAQKDSEARPNPRARALENVIDNSERTRTTNTDSSEAIERNEAYESFSAGCLVIRLVIEIMRGIDNANGASLGAHHYRLRRRATGKEMDPLKVIAIGNACGSEHHVARSQFLD
jgi:hypothetical protein